MKKPVEQLLQDQLAACLAAMEDCLAHSRRPDEKDEYGHMRRNDVAYLAKLMKASARLTEALAKLNGETRHNVHVTRGVGERVGKGADKRVGKRVDKGGG